MTFYITGKTFVLLQLQVRLFTLAVVLVPLLVHMIDLSLVLWYDQSSEKPQNGLIEGKFDQITGLLLLITGV